MNVENLLLRGLFGASVLICGWMLAAMVTTKPASTAITHTGHTIATTMAAPTANTRMAG